MLHVLIQILNSTLVWPSVLPKCGESTSEEVSYLSSGEDDDATDQASSKTSFSNKNAPAGAFTKKGPLKFLQLQ